MNSQGELMVRTMPMVVLPDDDVKRIAELSTADLRQELAVTLEMTARSLLRLAMIVRTLEERGEDVSDLRLPLLTYLRQIAEGRLLPALVARFAECPSLIRRASRIPSIDQRRLADGDGVMLVVAAASMPQPHTGNGSALAPKWTTRLADPTKLQTDQIRQIFAEDHLRGEAEQILWLEERQKPAKTAARLGAVKHGAALADYGRNGLVVGRKFVPVSDVVAALNDLAETPNSALPEALKKALRASRMV